MKRMRLSIIVSTLSTVLFVACENDELNFNDKIQGKYVGKITNVDTSKNSNILKDKEEATAVVTKIADRTIHVHLYDMEIDTTFMLNYYEYIDDRVNVCFTGDDFENMYGHMLGEGHIEGGMMADSEYSENEWMHHLQDEHSEGDEHFGGFDIKDHTFGYQFTRIVNDEMYNFLFQGSK